MREAYIIGGVRTPIGNFGGALSSVRPDDLAAHVISQTISKFTALDPAAIDDVVFGCANQAGEDNRNVARMAALIASLPVTVPGQTVNRLCASGLSAVIDAARAIMVGDSHIMLAGGVESMSRAPWVMAKPTAAFSRSPEVFDTTLGWRFINPRLKETYGVDSMGETAENVAADLKISREAQDTYAAASQAKAAAALKANYFADEIAPITIDLGRGKTAIVSTDEFMRPDTTMESLAKLKPPFRAGGSVTAGNASGINDGACAVLLASPEACKKYSLNPIARVVSSAVAGVAPRVMGLGPVPAIQKLLTLNKLDLKDINLFELNEAFAAQVLGVCQQLGISSNDPRINPHGGAIALGHPLGMSGARLVLTATRTLQQTKEQRAICSMCIGVGQGMAAMIERV